MNNVFPPRVINPCIRLFPFLSFSLFSIFSFSFRTGWHLARHTCAASTRTLVFPLFFFFFFLEFGVTVGLFIPSIFKHFTSHVHRYIYLVVAAAVTGRYGLWSVREST